MSGWRTIESAPKAGQGGPLVILFQRDKGTFIGRWFFNSWISVPGDYGRKPTHWQPLPAPPTGES